jgi:ABC-type hemin transport system substrate-binding protein
MKAHPLISTIKQRIRQQKAWSRRALFPNFRRDVIHPRRVYLITRNERRFAVVAQSRTEADAMIEEVPM